MLKSKALNKKNGVGFFARWVKWEGDNGDKKTQEKVAARKTEWMGVKK